MSEKSEKIVMVKVSYSGDCKDFILKIAGTLYTIPSTKYKPKAKPVEIPESVYEKYSDKLDLVAGKTNVKGE